VKIPYPQIHPADIQAGDTILSQWSGTEATNYFEWTVEDTSKLEGGKEVIYYLIDRPKPVFPEDYGTLIIAKKVRGIEFPEGIVLARQRGGYSAAYQGPQWKSIDQRVDGKDNHGERQIEDWVLAKAVPA
jgi:hypothetical protein